MPLGGAADDAMVGSWGQAPMFYKTSRGFGGTKAL